MVIINPPLRYSMISFGILVLFGAYIVFFDWFIVADEIYGVLGGLSVITAFFLSLLIYVRISKEGFRKIIYTRLDPKNKYSHRIYFFLALFIGSQMFSYLAIAHGVPSALHYSLSKEGSMKVSIKRKNHSRRNKRCLTFQGFQLFNGKFCRVPTYLWDNINEGDQVELKGSSSYWGFYANELIVISKLDNRAK